MKSKHLSLLLLAALSACSSKAPTKPEASEQFEMAVTEGPRVVISKKAERTAKAMHNYLIGELAYDKENFSRAEASFLKASEYADEPVGPVHLKLSELLLKGGNLEKALEESQRAIDAERENSYPWLLRGGIFEAMGRFDQARELYREVMSRFPGSSEAHILFAAISARIGDAATAIEPLQSYIGRQPKDDIAHGLLGQLFESQSNFTKAFDQYQFVQKLNGQPDGFSLDLARVLIKDQKIARLMKIKTELPKKKERNVLIEQLLNGLSEDPVSQQTTLRRIQAFADGQVDLSELHFRMAVQHAQEQRPNEALRELSVLLAIDPKYELGRYYRASMYAGSGRKKEAIEDLLSVEPDQELYIKSRTFAAFLLRQDGDLVRAEKVTREALSADPDDKHLFSYLILVLKDQHKYSDAEKLLRKSLEQDPKDERNLFNYAVIQKELGRNDEAMATMEKIIEINPRNAEALNYVAYALAESGSDLSRAQELSTRALQASPEDAFYLDTLGWIHYRKNELDKAAEILRRAVTLSGNDLVVLEHYGDVLLKQEKVPEAYEVFRMAIEKSRDAETIKGSAVSAEDKKLRIRLEEKLSALTSKHPELVLSTR